MKPCLKRDVTLMLLYTPTSRHVQNEGSEQIYDMNHYCMTIINAMLTQKHLSHINSIRSSLNVACVPRLASYIINHFELPSVRVPYRWSYLPTISSNT